MIKKSIIFVLVLILSLLSGCQKTQYPPTTEITQIEYNWDAGGAIPDDPDYRDAYIIFKKDNKVFLGANSLNDYSGSSLYSGVLIELPAAEMDNVISIIEKHDMLTWKNKNEKDILDGASFDLVISWESAERAVSSYGVLELYRDGLDELKKCFKDLITKYS